MLTDVHPLVQRERHDFFNTSRVETPSIFSSSTYSQERVSVTYTPSNLQRMPLLRSKSRNGHPALTADRDSSSG